MKKKNKKVMEEILVAFAKNESGKHGTDEQMIEDLKQKYKKDAKKRPKKNKK